MTEKTFEEMTLAERIDKYRIEKVNAQPKSLRVLAKYPERLRFDLAIQRNLRWSDEQKSKLIESILLGFPIPAVYTLKSDDNEIWLYDGKQRLDCCVSFQKDEWEIADNIPPVYGVDIRGLKFSELPEEFQELIEEQNIVFYQLERLTEEQRDELFHRLNSGTPLSNVEITRAILGTKLLTYINSILEEGFFSKSMSFTTSQKDKFINQEMILQIMGVVTGENLDLSGKSVREYALNIRTEGISEESKQIMKNTVDYISEAFENVDEKIAKKILKKNDVIAIFGAAEQSIENGTEPKMFGELCVKFLQKQTTNYQETKTSGSAKKDKVLKRIQILANWIQENKEAVSA